MTCNPAVAARRLPTRVRLSQTLIVWSLLLASVGAAQPSLSLFLAQLEGSPELAAAQAAVDAAEAQLAAARDPVALEARGSYSHLEIDESKLGAAQAPTDPDGGFAAGTLTGSGFQLATTLRFRPLPFGDIADLVRQREIELATRHLELQSARAALEVRALEAALSSRLAARSVTLAEAGVEAANQGLTATRRRFELGAANARDLRDAEGALLEAQTLLDNARSDAETARLNVRSLVGETPAPSFTDLTALGAPAQGTPLTIAQARLQTQLAALGIGAAQRELYPVAQASYSWNVSDASTLSASLESRTLQPSLGYNFQDPPRSTPQNAVTGTFQIGVSATISVSALKTLEATQQQQRAAEEGLKAQTTGSAVQEASLRAAYQKAVREAGLESRQFANAQLTYRENVTRQELGLSSPLETQTSLIELLQADLERRSSDFSALSALLDLYELYALPPSEALP